MPEGKFKIFVHHYPETAAFALSAGADLALSGDTHGGQVRLPFIGALVRISRFGYYFERGMHAVEGAMLYVSSGVGMEGGMIPRVRIFCPPEIVLLEIMPEEKQAKAGG